MDNSQITDDQNFHKNLLEKYMKLIDDEEGVVYFENIGFSEVRFTDAELTELNRIKTLINHA